MAFYMIHDILASRWYNFRMPTPFYHLSVAFELLEHGDLADPIRQRLLAQRGAFLFGNTAPDVQVVSKQAREATHFFTLPFKKDAPLPWERLVIDHPSLATPGSKPDEQAAFLAGYLCHLQADWLWISELFLPVFGPDVKWSTFPQRLYLHNVLRSYLDRQVLSHLPLGIASELKATHPRGWLPFVKDVYLREWRDYLSRQLEPGEAAQTVEVFAARQGIPIKEFYRLLDSEERMDQEIFSHLPRAILEQYRQRLISINLSYLNEVFRPGKNKNVRNARTAGRSVSRNPEKYNPAGVDHQSRPL